MIFGIIEYPLRTKNVKILHTVFENDYLLFSEIMNRHQDKHPYVKNHDYHIGLLNISPATLALIIFHSC